MYNKEYKDSVDKMANEMCTVSAADILNKINESEKSKDNVIKFKKKKSPKKIIAIMAAAVATLGLAVGAMAANGIGPFGNKIKEQFDDDVAQEIVNSGYLYEVNQTVTSEDGLFTANLIAVTGDEASPKLLMDLTINDEALAANNDRIRLLAYIISEEEYDNNLEAYGPWEAYGNRDEELGNVYHFLIDGPSAWMNGDYNVVVDVWQIDLNYNADGYYDEYDTHLEFRFTPGLGTYHPTYAIWFEGNNKEMTISYGGIDYKLCYLEFGAYRTDLFIEYYFEGTDIAGSETDYDKLHDKLQENWLELSDELTLVIDGEEYHIIDEQQGYSYCNKDMDNLCTILPAFPSIDIKNAKEVLLKYDDTVIDISDCSFEKMDDEVIIEDTEIEADTDAENVEIDGDVNTENTEIEANLNAENVNAVDVENDADTEN